MEFIIAMAIVLVVDLIAFMLLNNYYKKQTEQINDELKEYVRYINNNEITHVDREKFYKLFEEQKNFSYIQDYVDKRIHNILTEDEYVTSEELYDYVDDYIRDDENCHLETKIEEESVKYIQDYLDDNFEVLLQESDVIDGITNKLSKLEEISKDHENDRDDCDYELCDNTNNKIMINLNDLQNIIHELVTNNKYRKF